MKVTFYGTRGSTPVAEAGYVEFGGNTSCVLMSFDNGKIAILDAGTGIRKLGNDMLEKSHEQLDNIFIILSHTHWDHIQGFPFFKLAYDPRRHFTIVICGKMDLKSYNIFSTQMQNDFFPVNLDMMGGDFYFWQPDDSSYLHPMGIETEFISHTHPGGANSYRFEDNGKILVYCSDIEHGDELDPDVVTLSRDADLLIHDAQYTPEELEVKKGWGHSTWQQAVEVAEKANVKRLALFHHDPEHDDNFLLNLEKECQEKFKNAFFAREGTTVEL